MKENKKKTQMHTTTFIQTQKLISINYQNCIPSFLSQRNQRQFYGCSLEHQIISHKKNPPFQKLASSDSVDETVILEEKGIFLAIPGKARSLFQVCWHRLLPNKYKYHIHFVFIIFKDTYTLHIISIYHTYWKNALTPSPKQKNPTNFQIPECKWISGSNRFTFEIYFLCLPPNVCVGIFWTFCSADMFSETPVLDESSIWDQLIDRYWLSFLEILYAEEPCSSPEQELLEHLVPMGCYLLQLKALHFHWGCWSLVCHLPSRVVSNTLTLFSQNKCKVEHNE